MCFDNTSNTHAFPVASFQLFAGTEWKEDNIHTLWEQILYKQKSFFAFCQVTEMLKKSFKII